MINNEIDIRPPAFKDRKGWLIFFGIVQILFGAFCLLMVFFMMLGTVMSAFVEQEHGAPMSARTMIPSFLMYIALSVWFIWMGIGSIKAQRWARALILVTSWLWFVIGLTAFAAALIYMPQLFDKMASSEEISSTVAAVIKYIAIGFMAVVYIIIPGVLILFYRGPNVKATCEFRDKKIRWTDRCPLPVLALSLMFCLGSLFFLTTLCYGSVIPFFGYFLSGLPGAAVVLVVEALLVYLTWGTYKLKTGAWWGAVALVVVGSLSGVITFLRVDLMEMYEKMNYSEQELELLRQFDLIQSQDMAVFISMYMILYLGYLIYVRKFF